MPLRVVDGKLLVVGSALVTNDDCCCDDPDPDCSNCIVRDPVPDCNCYSSDFTESTCPSLQLDISGSMGSISCGSCPTLSATFTAACNASKVTSEGFCGYDNSWVRDFLICEYIDIGTGYRAIAVRVGVALDNYQVSITTSQIFVNYDYADSTPSVPEPAWTTSPGSLAPWAFSSSKQRNQFFGDGSPVYYEYYYEVDAINCPTADCNYLILKKGCPTSFTAGTNISDGGVSCTADSLTITLSVI